MLLVSILVTFGGIIGAAIAAAAHIRSIGNNTDGIYRYSCDPSRCSGRPLNYSTAHTLGMYDQHYV